MAGTKYECEQIADFDPGDYPKRVGNEIWDVPNQEPYADADLCREECTPCPNGWPYCNITVSWTETYSTYDCIRAFGLVWTKGETKVVCPRAYYGYPCQGSPYLENYWVAAYERISFGQVVSEDNPVQLRLDAGSGGVSALAGGVCYAIQNMAVNYNPIVADGLGNLKASTIYAKGAECGCGNVPAIITTIGNQIKTGLTVNSDPQIFFFSPIVPRSVSGSAVFVSGLTVAWNKINQAV